MKIASALLLLVVLPAVVVDGKSNKNSNKSNKNKDVNTSGGGGGGGKEPSAFSKFLGGFRTIIGIMRTGNADDVAQATCDGVAKGFGIEDNMICACGAQLVDGLHEVAGALECFSTSETCLETDSVEEFCGTALLEADISAGLSTPFGGYVKTCLGVEVPHDLGMYQVCIESTFTDRGLDACAAQMNGDECGCSVCDDAKFSVVFDCSNANISPFPGIPLYGPKVDTCQQLDYQQSA